MSRAPVGPPWPYGGLPESSRAGGGGGGCVGHRLLSFLVASRPLLPGDPHGSRTAQLREDLGLGSDEGGPEGWVRESWSRLREAKATGPQPGPQGLTARPPRGWMWNLLPAPRGLVSSETRQAELSPSRASPQGPAPRKQQAAPGGGCGRPGSWPQSLSAPAAGGLPGQGSAPTGPCSRL